MNQEHESITVVRRAVKEFLQERNLLAKYSSLLVFFSGGRDCSVLLDALCHVVPELAPQINIMAALVRCPHHMYEHHAGFLDGLKTYWKDRGIDIKILDANFEDPKSCKECKNIRRGLLDPYLATLDPQKVLIGSGYSLYDFVAYYLEFREMMGEAPDYTHLNSQQELFYQWNFSKLNLVQSTPTGYTFIRPLGLAKWSDVHDYSEKAGMPVLKVPCEHYKSKYKRKNKAAIEEECKKTSYMDIVRAMEDKGLPLPHTARMPASPLEFSDC